MQACGKTPVVVCQYIFLLLNNNPIFRAASLWSGSEPFRRGYASGS